MQIIICSIVFQEHFTQKSYFVRVADDRRILKPDAIPTIFDRGVYPEPEGWKHPERRSPSPTPTPAELASRTVKKLAAEHNYNASADSEATVLAQGKCISRELNFLVLVVSWIFLRW